MRRLNLLWLVCLFVLFDQIHLQSFLPPVGAFVSSQKAENLRVPVEAGPSKKADSLRISLKAIPINFASNESDPASDITVGMAYPAGDIALLEADAPPTAEPPAVPAESASLSDNQPSDEASAPRRQVSKEELCDTVISAAQDNNLPVGFLIRLIWQESGFDSRVVSSAGAQGVAQFMPKVAAEWGLEDPFDPLQALPASARLLRSLHRQFGNLGLAAAAYNAGSGRIQNWLTKRGKLPQETRSYVMNITGHPAEKWVKAAPHSISFRLPNRAPCREIANELDAATIPLPVPRPAAPVMTASADANFKTIKTSYVTPRAPMSKIAAPAPIVADRALGNGKKTSIAKITPTGKRQQLILAVKETKKSPSQAKVHVAVATKSAKAAAPAKSTSKATKAAAAKGPMQLAMVMRTSKK